MNELKQKVYGIKLLGLHILIVILSLIANIMVKVLRFKKIIKYLTNEDDIDFEALSARRLEHLDRIVTGINGISHKVPWRMKCYESAIVMLILAKLMRFSIAVEFGVNRKGNQLNAHAWTWVPERLLTGGDEKNEFTSVYRRFYKGSDPGLSIGI